MYRAEIKVISRRGVGGNAKSLAAVLAYRLGGALVDPNGRAWDYTGKGSVVATDSRGFADPQAFCDAVESVERRKDSQLGREAVLSVDRRLDPAAARRCLAAWCQQNLDRNELPWVAALHSPKSLDGQRNPHFHVIWSDRPVGGNGLGLKRRLKPTERAEQLAEMRASWAAIQNAELEAVGQLPDLTHERRSAAAEGPAEPKMGPALAVVRRKGLQAAPEDAVAVVKAVAELRRQRKRQRRSEARRRPSEAVPPISPSSPPAEPLVAARAATPSEVMANAVPVLAPRTNVASAPSRGAALQPLLGESGPPPSDPADPGRRGPKREPLRTAIASYRSAQSTAERSAWMERVLLIAMRRYRRLKKAAKTVFRALGATKHTQVTENIKKKRAERDRSR